MMLAQLGEHDAGVCNAEAVQSLQALLHKDCYRFAWGMSSCQSTGAHMQVVK